ncbi:MAG: cation diffusion facilitator family transporter [Syntrophorhabdaceae bacterium]
MRFEVKQKIALIAAASALILASGKFTIGFFSGSLAVVSSGVDSLLDVFMSAMNFYAIRKASEPADEIHRYGHGKVEDIAGAIQSLVIVFSGLYIVFKSMQTYIHKGIISYTFYDFLVMGISLMFSFMISTFLQRIGKRTGSNALIADALHYRSDLYSNSGALIAIILTYFTSIILFDLIFAVFAGLIILSSAIQIFRKSFSGIMDSRLPDSIEDQIRDIINDMSFPIAGFHRLRTRKSGSSKYIDFHLLACRKVTIDEAHSLADRIESRIKMTIADADVIVHVEPCKEKCDLTEITCILKDTRKRV